MKYIGTPRKTRATRATLLAIFRLTYCAPYTYGFYFAVALTSRGGTRAQMFTKKEGQDDPNKQARPGHHAGSLPSRGQAYRQDAQAHQRAHRAKMHGTRAGWIEHQKREQRRANEGARVRKQQRKEWNG